ncbi:DUF58 domain-containing protein [Paramaledivibacter caminithermalis]|uniref:DUF58 domain-containing protein n=1 Tax=Paramaledivibacter caminithermalis (strain DSM 15212 / CIP 107654 / DViRD3) TaxID=1121301 RepID=A0A1M6JMC4_PARC5|nr:DUF58 domain-containing protein [Paramaledivibacter caminithermalis]SHJ47783.1 Protein of unknown function DUF58 [Paramaledivibacter caminithermalis DSM 15212]
MLDKGFLNKLNRLKLNYNLSINKGYGGGRKSNAKGCSSEFSDFREYIHGDDFRKIDWNAYGRFEKLYIKEFMEEREILVNIFLDTSKSMDFGEPKKSYFLKNIAMAFSYISLNNLDRLNLYYQEGTDLKDSGYLRGKNSLSKVIDILDNLQFQSKTDMFPLINKKAYESGISIIISDLFTDEFKETIKYLSYMNQKIIVLHLLDKKELKPDLIGDLRLIDCETMVDNDVSINPQILNSYEKTLKAFIQNIKETAKKYGSVYSLISNELLIEEIIFEKLIKVGILR